MPDKATLYPIYALDYTANGLPFDTSIFPFQIIENVAIEDVRPMFDPDAFAWVQNELGRRDVEELENIDFAIVHRYAANELGEGGRADMESDRLVRNLVACLRLIRPMRQQTSLMRGELGRNGKINVQHFEHPNELLEVPEVQKPFRLRRDDLDLLRAVAN